jgi:hypothetical protein
VGISNLINKNNPVGIAHRHSRKPQILTGHIDRYIHITATGMNTYRDKIRGKFWKPHIDCDRNDSTVMTGNEMQIFNARKSFERYVAFLRVMMVVNILTHTTRAVATHLRFRTVGIENAHFKIGIIRGKNHYDSVTTYAAMPVTEPARYFSQAVIVVDKRTVGPSETAIHTIYIDVVVAKAMHFCKFHP